MKKAKNIVCLVTILIIISFTFYVGIKFFNKFIINKSGQNNLYLTNTKIVNFGDSIFGNFQGKTSVSQYISNINGANVYNMGFGGCQMSDRMDNHWKEYSMCNLAKAIVSNDFSQQEKANSDSSWTNKPFYFDDSLEILKSIDFSKIDIVTLSYGTNDYTAGDLLDNKNDFKDINTFAGALRYTIELLLSSYPNLKIVIGTPIWRCWLDDKQEIIDTSDSRTYAGGYNLSQMAEKIKEIGTEYHIQVIDAYNNLGLNKYNWRRFYDTTDTTHPNINGRQALGRLYAIELLK